MSYSISKEIRQVLHLSNQGNVEEALQLLIDYERNEGLTPEESLRYQILKSQLVHFLGGLEEGLKIVEPALLESIKLNKPLLSIDAIFNKFSCLIWLGRARESWDDIVYGEKLINSISDETPGEIEQRKALITYMKGFFYSGENKYDEALGHFNNSLSIFKRHEPLFGIIPFILGVMGIVYTEKGDLDLGLKCLKKSLNLSKGNVKLIKMSNTRTLMSIGSIYYQQGDLDQAIEYYEKSLKMCEQYRSPLTKRFKGLAYSALIKIFVDKNSSELAQEYFNQFSQYNEKNRSRLNITLLELSKARILKSSSRIQKRAKAENILKKIIKEYDIKKVSLNHGRSEEFSPALVELCDFYIKELHSSNDMDILTDIQPLITRLLQESERTNSYLLLAQTNLLQGKLSLLRVNMADARHYLTQAQRIAEKHGLQLLARTISIEHDKMLEQLEKWEKMNKADIEISERIDLASLSKIVNQMQGSRALDPPEIVDEQPILLLIIGQDGVSYFNNSFIDEWDFHDLFSSFMSAFNNFSSEIFSESIDRIKIGDNLILIKPVEQFLVCYVIKGQSYPALQRLTRFSDAIKWNTEISEALNKSMKTGEMLELNNPSSLGDVVNEIFNIN